MLHEDRKTAWSTYSFLRAESRGFSQGLDHTALGPAQTVRPTCVFLVNKIVVQKASPSFTQLAGGSAGMISCKIHALLLDFSC